MPAQKSYTMDAFHIPFNGDSICNRDEVLSEKLPPDKVKVKLLTTAAYMVTIIMCILIPATSYNGVPAVLRTSSVGVIPEDMFTCDSTAIQCLPQVIISSLLNHGQMPLT